MDPISNKKQPKTLSYKDILAQPLDLRESLKIRDGLSEADTSAASHWIQYPPTRWPTLRLTHFWVSNN